MAMEYGSALQCTKSPSSSGSYTLVRASPVSITEVGVAKIRCSKPSLMYLSESLKASRKMVRRVLEFSWKDTGRARWWKDCRISAKDGGGEVLAPPSSRSSLEEEEEEEKVTWECSLPGPLECAPPERARAREEAASSSDWEDPGRTSKDDRENCVTRQYFSHS
jgi:hypothetical protein